MKLNFKWVNRGLFILSLGYIVLFFQNCDSYTQDLELETDTIQQDNADELPFAYDFTLDHMAYMSCKGQSFYSGTHDYFSFKAGAFKSDNGVFFRPNFLENYGGLSDSTLSQYLGLSQRNSGAGVVMSVRESGQFQNTVEFEQGTPSVNTPQLEGLMYAPTRTLTDQNVLDILLDNKSSTVNYLKGFPGLDNKRSFDGSIRLFSTNNLSTNGADVQYRDLLQDRAYLSFTFATGDLESPGLRARSPYAPTGTEDSQALTSVWGKGYQFTFSQYDNTLPGGSFRPSSPKRAVTSVTGYSLENEANMGENWNCPDNEKYVIVRPEDATRRYDGIPISESNHPFNQYDRVDPMNDSSAMNLGTTYDDGGPGVGGYYFSYQADYDGDGELNFVRHKVICPLVADQLDLVNDSPLEQDAWERIRNILPAEDWFVFRGSRYNCIVPKNSGGNVCYADGENIDESQRRLIQYFVNEGHPEIRIEQEREDQQDEDIIIPEIEVTRDCGPNSSQSHGGFNFCPHVLSVCYRQ